MRTCNSEYSYESVKNCRFMFTSKSKGNDQRCACKRNCALCTAGGTKEIELITPKAEKRSRYSGSGLKPRTIKNYVPALPVTYTTHKVPILMHPPTEELNNSTNDGTACSTCDGARRVIDQPRGEEWCCVFREHALLPNAEHYACPEWRYFTYVKTGGDDISTAIN